MKLKDLLKDDKGLGDTVERFTQKTGIKHFVEKTASSLGKDCGCAKRKEALNKTFSYKKEK